MRLLLDTHAYLWWRRYDRQLSALERDAIEDARNDVYLSAASVWEIEIKVAIGKLRVKDQHLAGARRLGVRELPITWQHAEAMSTLPALHKDPFDRMLLAQARVEGLTIVTRDPRIRSYPGFAFLPPKNA